MTDQTAQDFEERLESFKRELDEPGARETDRFEGSSELFKELVENTAYPIISIDEHGLIETFNTSASDLFGYTRSKAIGQNISMLMPEPYRSEFDGYLSHDRETGEVKILAAWREIEGRRKDGSTVPIEINVNELDVGGRRVFGVTIRDLTESKRVMAQLEIRSKDILELSTPVISVWDGVLILPLIGTLDSHRMHVCAERALTRISEGRHRVLILDITGVPVIDTMVANHLVTLAASVRLMGGSSILTGISPEIAMTMIGLGVDLEVLITRASLREGLRLAIEMAAR